MDFNSYELAVMRCALMYRRVQLKAEHEEFIGYTGHESDTIKHEIETIDFMILRSYDENNKMEKK